ncbi:MAG: linoleoyl-CoA desaturase, partial [Gaiellales bacterium]|nr:linoleoyl-CoA desaturase [Gaiellales bacterium]
VTRGQGWSVVDTASPGFGIKFTSGGAFHREVDGQVKKLLADSALVRRAYLLLWLKALLVLLWVAASYAVLVFVAAGPLQAVAASLSLGLAAAGIGFTIMHDANHQAFARSRWVNRVMALSLDLIGGSSYVWSAKHLAHHTYPNVTEHDPDIDSLPFARFDPAQRHRPWHRYQHIYIWALYGVVTVRWQFLSDFAFLARRRAGRSPLRWPRGGALATLIAGKGAFLGWALVVPLLFHPLLTVLACFMATSVVASLALALVFQLSHCVIEAEFVDPGGDRADSALRSWQIHQIESTVDFARGNRLLRLYAGGLNHQVEHHLYSRLPHTLYPRIAAIVEAGACAHGVRYTHLPTFRQALRSHINWLKLMGAAPAADPAS